MNKFVPLCPSCRRVPSERLAVYGDLRCKDPAHDQADVGPIAVEILRTIRDTIRRPELDQAQALHLVGEAIKRADREGVL